MRLAPRWVLLLVALASLTASPSWAHKVNLFAYFEGGIVYTESYFPDGKKVEGGMIKVLDAGGRKLLEGKTDNQGLFSFPLQKKEDLTIVLDATMGHKNSFVLKKSEM